MKATQKQAYTLIHEYTKLYKKRYQKSPNINRYVEKWGMIDTIDDHGFDETLALLEYYFTTGAEGHPLSYFYRTAHMLRDSKMETERDAEFIRKVMEETRERVEQETGN